MDAKSEKKLGIVLGILRIFLGLIFLWAFFDKLFGLGFATPAAKSWLAGGSPTSGFLANAVSGPFAGFFHSLAGQPLVDWLFMLGLLGIGVGLTFGIAVRLSSIFGMIQLFLMWAALLPTENHPFLDEHLVYILVLLCFIFSHAGRYIGYGKSWANTKAVKNHRILE